MDFPGQIDPVLQKEKLLTSGRDSAAYLAGVMQNLALTGSERAELRACCDQLYRVQFENRGPAGARPIAGPRARLVPRT
jgi:hypothetical protein